VQNIAQIEMMPSNKIAQYMNLNALSKFQLLQFTLLQHSVSVVQDRPKCPPIVYHPMENDE